MNAIREWLDSREPRERQILLAGFIVVFLTLLHSLVWEPLVEGYRTAETELASIKADLAWMQKNSAEIRRLLKGNRKNRSAINRGSLNTLVDRSARVARLQSVIRRIEPRGNNQVQIWFNAAPFNHIVQWIDALRIRYSINVNYISVRKTATPGKVTAHVILNRIP